MRTTRHLIATALVAAALVFPLGVLASHGFTDVPTNSTFHDDIDAIADAGVTTGCAIGKYCPKDLVTREQMAAFLNRLGALGAGKTPVVNADKVDGYGADALTRFASARQEGLIGLVAIPDITTVISVTITAPRSGYVLINAQATINNGNCSSNCSVVGQIHHVTGGADGVLMNTTADPSAYRAIGWTDVFPVASGANTFEVRIGRYAMSTGSIYAIHSMMTAQFSPFDGTGASVP